MADPQGSSEPNAIPVFFQGPRTVADKRESYRLIDHKAFGNMLQTWSSIPEAERSSYAGELRLRYKGKGGNSKFSFIPFPKQKLDSEYSSWVQDGIAPEDIVICEAGPDNCVVIQGEIFLGEDGLNLWYNTANGITCREAMKNPTKAVGLEAISLLKSAMDPASYDDLQVLLEIYPDSTIEFSTFSKRCGWAGRNTIFWEVRNY